MRNVKITVLKKHFYPDMADEYLTEGRSVGPCPLLEEGDTFLYKGSAVMPEGFCPWAWIDVYRGISGIAAGATNVPWNNRDGMTILCCTDGIRPVVFRIEAMDE
jgi:uncharacterized repeat protein (TIGR04076 family)